MMKSTLSWVASLVAAVAASSGLPPVSRGTSTTFLPRTPPLAFASSTASLSPFCSESPKVACSPVRVVTSPMRIASSAGASSLVADSAAAGGVAAGGAGSSFF